MIRNRLRHAGALLAVVAGTSLTGCIKIDQNTQVMPDGSGKVTMRVGMKTAMAQMAESGEDGGPPVPTESEDLERDWEGFVAFTEPVKTEEGEWTYYDVSGYFTDINKVKIYDTDDETGERKLQTAFKMRQEGEGWVLDVENPTLAEMGEDLPEDDGDTTPEMKEMMKGMMEAMLAGLEIRFSYTLPGQVSAVQGLWGKDGNTADVKITVSDLFETEKMKKLSAAESRSATCGESNITEETMAAWKSEFADAKDKWAARKAEDAAENGDEGGSDDDGM